MQSGMATSLHDVRVVVGLTSGRISGVDIFSVGLVRELSRLGIRAEVLQTMADSATSDALPASDDVPISRLPLPELPTWPERWASLKAYLGREPTIYVPNYDDRHSAVVPTLPPHVRVLGIGHSDDPHYYRHILTLAPYWDAVVAVSSSIAAHLADLIPALESRMSVVPYGVAVPPEFRGAVRQSGNPLLAVYAGRIVQYQKRVFDLLRIAEETAERGSSARFTVAGNGDDQDVFAERAGNIASRNVDRVGSLANDEILTLLGKSHAFVLPSSFEGLPVSLLEAMANGCVPVVSAIRSGIPELIDHRVNGFLFDIGDTRAATDALLTLGSDERLRQSMARAAYETVKNRYNIEKMTEKYLAILEQMLASQYGRPIGRVSPPPSIHALDANMPPFPLPLRKLIAATREFIR
jgi:glycosyltransferase involved in cell wall biosynthesis